MRGDSQARIQNRSISAGRALAETELTAKGAISMKAEDAALTDFLPLNHSAEMKFVA
jgi:hypothetical protein